MNVRRTLLWLSIACMGAIHSAAAHAQTPLSSAFTYQGVLKSSGAPYSGTADLAFRLFDGPTGTVQIGSTIEVFGVSITDGLFTTSLDFGVTAFGGNPPAERWLEIAARTPGLSAGPFTTLLPRQRLAAVAYALHALSASIAGAQPNQVSFTNAANAFSGSSLAIDGSTLRVDAVNDRVGVGTGTPQAALHVAAGIGSQPSMIVSKDDDATTSISLAAPLRTWLIGQNLPPDGGDFDQFFIHDATMEATRLSINEVGNVGIGTNFPVARLHVAGAAHVEGGITIPPTTRTLTLSGMDFTPSKSTTPYDRGMYAMVSTGPLLAIFQAPVHLPPGATVTSMTLLARDNLPTGEMACYLRVVIPGVTDSWLSTVESSGAAIEMRSFTTTDISDPVIDPMHGYYVTVHWTTATPTAMALIAVRINYTVTSLQP